MGARSNSSTTLVHFDLIALFVIAAAGLSIVWSTLRLGISPMPTSRKVRAAMLALIPETNGDVHELGAGWGTLAWALAEKLPNARVIAWEASPIPFAFCWLRLRVQRRPNLMLRFANFHDADLREARVVTAYLWTGAMTRLAAKFDAELPRDAAVVTHTFAWPGKTPEAQLRVDDLYRTPVYRYRSGPHGDAQEEGSSEAAKARAEEEAGREEDEARREEEGEEGAPGPLPAGEGV